MTNANLNFADLGRTDFYEAVLHGAILQHIELDYADFGYADVSIADCRHCNLGRDLNCSMALHYAENRKGTCIEPPA